MVFGSFSRRGSSANLNGSGSTTPSSGSSRSSWISGQNSDISEPFTNPSIAIPYRPRITRPFEAIPEEIPALPPPRAPQMPLGIKSMPLESVRNLFRSRKSTAGASEGIVPPADRPKDYARGQKVKKEEIREICELVRKRFAADVELWGLQDAGEVDRPMIQPKIDKADATLAKIWRTLESWHREDLFESATEWEIYLDVRERAGLGGKRDWKNYPPWYDGR